MLEFVPVKKPITLLLAIAGLITVTTVASAIQNGVVTYVRGYRQSNEVEILKELLDFLAIPNIASDSQNIRKNAEYISTLLKRRGINTQFLEVAGAPPVVFGEIKAPTTSGPARTLIFYAHYDGQPVEPAKWTTPDPFKPVIFSSAFDGQESPPREITLPASNGKTDPEWRIYARSASDDKAPIVAILRAVDALRAGNLPLTSNIKFFFEGEEEAGSPHLESIISKYSSLLNADAWIVCDGPVDQTRNQQLYFGARGVTGFELTVYGPRRELHSGHYGNWAPNPAMMLAQLLASMKDADGRVLVEKFYDGIEPLTQTEQRALSEAPANDEMLKRELGIARTEGGGRKLNELITLPSLNIRGFQSSSIGPTARNVIPSSATASIDIRLVKGVDHKVEVERVLAHIRKQGYEIIETEPDENARRTFPRLVRISRQGGYNAARTSMDLAISRSIIKAVESIGRQVSKLPTLGGSVPLYLFTDTLKTPAIGVPIVNHDNNQHSANENLRIKNLWDGIEVMATIMTMDPK